MALVTLESIFDLPVEPRCQHAAERITSANATWSGDGPTSLSPTQIPDSQTCEQ